jgi:hypothetical protein
MDMTGDGHPDLVVFRDACDATVGSTHWDVYPWSVSGFASTPVAFAVPTSRCQVSFDQAAQQAKIAYATLDLRGAGHADLVVFKDMCDATVGTTHWDVYPWSPSGFAAAPVHFAIPAPRCQVSFDAASLQTSLSYATTTLTSLCTPSLVVFQDHCDSSVGASHWDVYDQP